MTQNNQDNVLCRIWAWEQDPRNGTAHHCHAASYGFKGGVYPKGDIERILAETPVQIQTMIWTLKTCEPNHDGAACEGCQYKSYRGLSHMYDLGM